MLKEVSEIIDPWLKDLEGYDLNQLLIQPTPVSWSLGQLYTHLINDTNFYITQARICIQSNDNQTEEMSPGAKNLFINNGFSDVMIAGDPGNDPVPQPTSKEQLKNDLSDLQKEINDVAESIIQSPFKGKTKHPGLDYFNAEEWLQFAEMHFRHHVRQKKRIDAFLQKSRS